MMEPRHGAQVVLIFFTTEKITDSLLQLIRDFLKSILDVFPGAVCAEYPLTVSVCP